MKAEIYNCENICPQKWNRLLAESSQNTPYLSYEFIDLITQKNWQALLIKQKNGDYIAAMPLEIKSKWGLKYAVQSKFAQNWGIFMRDKNTAKNHTFWSHRRKVQQLMVAALEALQLAFFHYHFHSSFSYLLPFHWSGYQVQVRYNFLLPLKNVHHQLQQLSSSTRRILQKETGQTWQWEEGSIENLTKRLENPLQGEKKNIYYHKKELALIKKLFFLLKKDSKVLVLNLKNEKGEGLADGLFVFHGDQCYYLFGGQSPLGKKHHAMTHLIWKAIQISMEKNCDTFNFEGSMENSIERFFRGFGAFPTTYFQVSKQNSIWIKIWRSLKF